MWTQTWIFGQNLWTDADSKFQYLHILDADEMDEVAQHMTSQKRIRSLACDRD